MSGELSRGGVLTLTAWWKKLLCLLVVLDLRVWYLFAEGTGHVCGIGVDILHYMTFTNPL